ncbi:DUF6134 family protein [Dongia sedimenti]|uniref:DUF6134 family protein n=1 Tax=Dongia sedimenti TaxID=3064282 RepID=A0ABU0YH49_9PROT|nr:DUF6134 family protein [Rhodospirillaceae bacterium R-7]
MLPRRRFLAAGLGGAVGLAFPDIAPAATAIVMPLAAADRRFSVLYEGDKIGTHTVLYSLETGETRVTTDVSLLVKVAFFTLFKFTHRSSETWRDGRLVSLRSVTVEHGDTLLVEGRATPQGFRVESKGGPFIASAATLTSNSLWTPAVLEQETVVDAQHGGVIGISARKFAEEPIAVAGRTIPATRYAFITPYLAGSIWYDRASLWVRGEFEIDGSKIQYQLGA